MTIFQADWTCDYAFMIWSSYEESEGWGSYECGADGYGYGYEHGWHNGNGVSSVMRYVL